MIKKKIVELMQSLDIWNYQQKGTTLAEIIKEKRERNDRYKRQEMPWKLRMINGKISDYFAQFSASVFLLDENK